MAGVPIARLTTEQLTVGERADLEAVLKDPGRFHCDGKEVTIAKDGASLSLYGFGLEQRKALIDAHRSARARGVRS